MKSASFWEVGGRGWSFVLLKYKFSNYKNNICSLYHPGSQEQTHSAWILKKGIIYIELNSVYKWTRNSKACKTSNTGKLLSPLLLKEQGEKLGWRHQAAFAVWRDTPTPDWGTGWARLEDAGGSNHGSQPLERHRAAQKRWKKCSGVKRKWKEKRENKHHN